VKCLPFKQFQVKDDCFGYYVQHMLCLQTTPLELLTHTGCPFKKCRGKIDTVIHNGHERYCMHTNKEMDRHMQIEKELMNHLKKFGATVIRECWIQGKDPSVDFPSITQKKIREHSYSNKVIDGVVEHNGAVRMDLVVKLPGNYKMYHIDVNVKELTCPSNVYSASKGELLKRAEASKVKQYTDHVDPEIVAKVSFVPFVVSTLGEFGPKAVKFLHEVKRRSVAIEETEEDDSFDDEVDIKTRSFQAKVGRVLAMTSHNSLQLFNGVVNKMRSENKSQALRDSVRSAAAAVKTA
jgi:hypothetical protein